MSVDIINLILHFNQVQYFLVKLSSFWIIIKYIYFQRSLMQFRTISQLYSCSKIQIITNQRINICINILAQILLQHNQQTIIIMQKLDKAHFVVQGTYDEQTQSCLICLEPISYPVECVKCKSLFCKKCADKWKKSNKKCPKKCSQGQWIFEPSKPLSILLRCPYQNEQCKNMSPQEFEMHYKICDKSSKEMKEMKTEQDLKKQYLCKFGHKLTYIGTKYREYIFTVCSQCEQRRLSRSICLQCKQHKEEVFVYCCMCRNPPIKRSMCPQQHKFKIREHRLHTVTCDYCAEYVSDAGEYCYNQKICDYAVCIKCFNQLPKQQNTIIFQVQENPFSNRNGIIFD